MFRLLGLYYTDLPPQGLSPAPTAHQETTLHPSSIPAPLLAPNLSRLGA